MTRTIVSDNDDDNMEASVAGEEVDEIRDGSCRYVLEFITLIFISSTSIIEILTPNVIELQYCRTQLNISKEECFNHTNTHDTEIQIVASNFIMMATFMKILIPVLATLCVGPWSDAYGRKPLILVPCIGYFVSSLLWMWLTTTSLHPFLFILTYVPVGLTGGAYIFLLATFCYTCDTVNTDNRAFRLGTLHGFYWLAETVAVLIAPHIAELDNYGPVFGVTTVSYFLCSIYIWFCVPESVQYRTENNEIRNSRNPLSLTYVCKLFESLFHKLRPDIRMAVILLIIDGILNVIASSGSSDVLYLYLQHVLNWNLSEFMPLKLTIYAVIIVMIFGGIWLFCQKLQISELYLSFIGTYLMIIGYIILSFTTDVRLIYAGVILFSFTGVMSALTTSYLSKLIPADEFGKILSLATLTKSVAPIIASFVYTTVYNHTIETFPSAFFLLSSTILLLKMYTLLLCFVLSPIHEERFKITSSRNPIDRSSSGTSTA